VTDQVLLVSRISLLALVYLVFLRVARAVVVEIRAENGTGPVKARRRPRRVPAGVAAQAATPTSTLSDPHPPTPLAAASHKLLIRAPKSVAGQTFAVSGETTIGRASGCAVLIDDTRVSKIHARLFLHGDRWMVEDLGSTNGTSVNGERVDGPRPLAPRDIIQVGDVAMEFT